MHTFTEIDINLSANLGFKYDGELELDASLGFTLDEVDSLWPLEVFVTKDLLKY